MVCVVMKVFVSVSVFLCVRIAGGALSPLFNGECAPFSTIPFCVSFQYHILLCVLSVPCLIVCPFNTISYCYCILLCVLSVPYLFVRPFNTISYCVSFQYHILLCVLSISYLIVCPFSTISFCASF